MRRPPPRSTLFPYTTLFRSSARRAPAVQCRSCAERAPRLAPFLIQFPVEVQPFEHELDGGRDGRWVAGRTELRDGALHPGDLQRLLHILGRRLRRRDVHRRTTLEGRQQRVELAERERAVEDVQHRALRKTLDDALLGDIANGLELDLA